MYLPINYQFRFCKSAAKINFYFETCKKFDEAGVRTAILYQFVPVYVVCIMNFMPKEHEVTKFRTDVALREKSSDSMFSDKLRFIYLSLPFFDKSEEECETGFEKWIYVLKYMEVLERLPFTAQKKIFDHLAKLADVRCLSSEEQEKYDESIKAAAFAEGIRSGPQSDRSWFPQWERSASK